MDVTEEKKRTIYFLGNRKNNENGATCGIYGESRDAYSILVGRAERKRPLEIHRRRCEDTIKN